MKTLTLKYVEELRLAIRTRTDRVNHLRKIIDEERKSYSSLNLPELLMAVGRVANMGREIAEHRKFCEKAQAEINSYYACPTKA